MFLKKFSLLICYSYYYWASIFPGYFFFFNPVSIISD